MSRGVLVAAATCCAVHLLVLAAIGTTGVALGLWVLPVAVVAVAAGVVLVRARRSPVCDESAGQDRANALER